MKDKALEINRFNEDTTLRDMYEILYFVCCILHLHYIFLLWKLSNLQKSCSKSPIFNLILFFIVVQLVVLPFPPLFSPVLSPRPLIYPIWDPSIVKFWHICFLFLFANCSKVNQWHDGIHFYMFHYVPSKELGKHPA